MLFLSRAICYFENKYDNGDDDDDNNNCLSIWSPGCPWPISNRMTVIRGVATGEGYMGYTYPPKISPSKLVYGVKMTSKVR